MKRYDSYKPSGISWIGEIPSHWEVKKIRSLYALRNEKVSDKDFEALSVSKMGITPQLEDAVKTDNGDNRKLVRKGDFVVNSRSDRKGSCGVSDYNGSVSLINIVTHPISDFNSKYYHLMFRSNDYVEEFYRLGKGIVADLWTTKFDEMRNISVPFPDREEQDKIVEFLTEKTRLIDEQYENLNKEIQYLQELKQAEIANVVTRGLNPDVPMKDSGIPWIGQIPEHWSEERAKYLFIKENRPVREKDEIITCFRDGQVTLRKNRRTEGFTESLKEIGYQGIRKGDLVIHQMDAFAGSTGISDSDGKSTPVYIVCTPASEKVYNPYFGHVIRFMGLNGFIQSLYKGIRERSSSFGYDVFSKQYLPVPPFNEQKAIVEYIEQKNKFINEMIANLRAEIEFLTEYKQRLISDAVTGQIDVRDYKSFTSA